jgi:hypothetical protein
VCLVSHAHAFSAQTQNRMEGASELALLGDLLGFTGASEGEPGDKDMIELQAMPIFVNGVTEVKMQGRDLVEFPADLLEAGVSIFLITHLFSLFSLSLSLLIAHPSSRFAPQSPLRAAAESSFFVVCLLRTRVSDCLRVRLFVRWVLCVVHSNFGPFFSSTGPLLLPSRGPTSGTTTTLVSSLHERHASTSAGSRKSFRRSLFLAPQQQHMHFLNISRNVISVIPAGIQRLSSL